jgi:hypothetical protein
MDPGAMPQWVREQAMERAAMERAERAAMERAAMERAERAAMARSRRPLSLLAKPSACRPSEGWTDPARWVAV